MLLIQTYLNLKKETIECSKLLLLLKKEIQNEKQNKRRSSKRKANRQATRQRELLKVIAPALKEGEICTISDIDKTSVCKITGKRKIKWLHSLIEPDCRMLDSAAKELLQQLQRPSRYTVDETDSDISEDCSADSADFPLTQTLIMKLAHIGKLPLVHHFLSQWTQINHCN